MNPAIIFLGVFILVVGLGSEISWYRQFKRFYCQDNGGGSLVFVGTGVIALIAGFFMADPPVSIYDPIEVIKQGGHR